RLQHLPARKKRAAFDQRRVGARQSVPDGPLRQARVELLPGVVGELDPAEGLTMAVLRIAKMGNPVLQQVASPVEDPAAPEIRRLAADMQEKLEDIGASGLAANQVFVAKRVVVYRIIATRIPEGSGLVPRPWTVMI